MSRCWHLVLRSSELGDNEKISNRLTITPHIHTKVIKNLSGHSASRRQSPLTKKEQMCARLWFQQGLVHASLRSVAEEGVVGWELAERHALLVLLGKPLLVRVGGGHLDL